MSQLSFVPIVFSLELKDMISQEKGLWKFNNSLALNAEYAEKIKKHIFETLRMLDQHDVIDKQIRWEILKYEIRKFIILLSKNLIREENKDN